MSPFAPFTEDQFRLMAMCKARAYTWEYIAAQVEMPIEVVERVAWTHEKPWQRFLTKAERLVAREAIAEVVGTLRRDLRETEPQHHATIVNSLSRVLKLQQDFAPPRRPRPATPPTNSVPIPVPVSGATPVPAPPTAPKPSLGPLPSLQPTISALVGLFFLLAAFFMGSGTSSRSLCDDVREPVTVVARPTIPADIREGAPTGHVVLTPPPWVREPCQSRHGAT